MREHQAERGLASYVPDYDPLTAGQAGPWGESVLEVPVQPRAAAPSVNSTGGEVVKDSWKKQVYIQKKTPCRGRMISIQQQDNDPIRVIVCESEYFSDDDFPTFVHRKELPYSGNDFEAAKRIGDAWIEQHVDECYGCRTILRALNADEAAHHVQRWLSDASRGHCCFCGRLDCDGRCFK